MHRTLLYLALATMSQTTLAQPYVSLAIGVHSGDTRCKPGAVSPTAPDLLECTRRQPGYALRAGVVSTNGAGLELGFIDAGRLRSRFYDSQLSFNYNNDFGAGSYAYHDQSFRNHTYTLAATFALQLGAAWTATPKLGVALSRGKAVSTLEPGTGIPSARLTFASDSWRKRGTYIGFAVQRNLTASTSVGIAIDSFPLGYDLIWPGSAIGQKQSGRTALASLFVTQSF
jgi:hypothetical protein